VSEVYRIVLKETGQIEEKENGRGEAIGRGIGTVAIEDDRDQDLENDANALAVETENVRVAAKNVTMFPLVVQMLPKERLEMNGAEKRTRIDERSVIVIRVKSAKRRGTAKDHAVVVLAIVVTRTRKRVVETTLEKMVVTKFVLKKNPQMIMNIPLRRSMMKNIINTTLIMSNMNPKKHHISKLKNTSSLVDFS